MKYLPYAATAALLVACGGNDTVEDDVIVTDDAVIIEPRDLAGGMEDSGMMEVSLDVLGAEGTGMGVVRVRDVADGVELDLNLKDIPQGDHAIHFHEIGRCDLPDFTSSGGHYNPAGVNHGFESAEPNPHAGDMRNITAPESGLVQVTVSNPRVSLSERDGYAPLFDSDGTALIIHAGADDYESQPTGAAGGRIACAVVER